MQIFSEKLTAAKQLLDSGKTVCLVGGGGKTTLMYALAQQRAQMGQRVLVGTTTHIYMPPRFYAADAGQAKLLWDQGDPAVIGTPVGEKLSANPTLLAQLRVQADVTILEADGAKGHPCKVPAEWEPVIDPECDLVVAVFGLSAIGKPLHQVCFRAEQAMALLGVSGRHILTPLDAARMLASPQGSKKDAGTRRWCAVLNQCDNGRCRKFAADIVRNLENMGETNVVITAFDEREQTQWNRI